MVTMGFTFRRRTRKRNIQGMMNDGINSISRFYLNNFRDAIYQLSIDYFLGNLNLKAYQLKMTETSNKANDVKTEAGDTSKVQSNASMFLAESKTCLTTYS